MKTCKDCMYYREKPEPSHVRGCNTQFVGRCFYTPPIQGDRGCRPHTGPDDFCHIVREAEEHRPNASVEVDRLADYLLSEHVQKIVPNTARQVAPNGYSAVELAIMIIEHLLESPSPAERKLKRVRVLCAEENNTQSSVDYRVACMNVMAILEGK